MSIEFPVLLTLRSPDDTAALARCIAPQLRRGDTILLAGEIGAGKTHFARALIQHLQATTGHIEDVPSPTFTLVQTYDVGDNQIWHADLYRLSSGDEIEELGLRDAFDTAICLIEWPERLGQLRPLNAIEFEFQTSDEPDERTLTLRTNARRWQGLLPVIAEFQTGEHA